MIIREFAAIFSFQYDASKLKQASSALDSFAQKANMVFGAVASHYALRTIFNAAQNIGQALENIGKSSQSLGISTQNFQELKFAAQKSGIEIEKFEDCFKELMLRSRDALTGQGDAAEGFKALGIAVKSSSGHMREPIGLLEEVADKVKNMRTQSDKIWALDKLFGDPGFKMLHMLDKGSLGLSEMRLEARNLGIVLEQDAIFRAEKFNKALKAMKASTNSLTSNILSTLMPGLTGLFRFMGSF